MDHHFVLHVNIRFVRSCCFTVYTKLPTAFFDHTKKNKITWSV